MISTSRFFLTAVLLSSAVAAVSYYSSDLALQDSNLQDQFKAQRHGVAADDGLAVAYLPAYVIPDGSPVDPCVTCRPRRTTHICRRNTGDRCPGRTSPACTTKRSSQSSASSTKRLCSTSSSCPAAASFSAGAGDSTEISAPYSTNRVKPNSARPKRFIPNA